MEGWHAVAQSGHQGNAWKKQVVLQHELTGTAVTIRSIPENAEFDWLDHQVAAREL